MKTCCPEQRYLQTRAVMLIEFTVGEDISHLDPTKLFKKCWGAWRNDGGIASLKMASIQSVDVEKRDMSKKEKAKKQQALKAKDRREAANEIRQVFNAALGEDTIKEKWPKVTTRAAQWPRKLEWTFWAIKKHNQSPRDLEIEFQPDSTTLFIRHRDEDRGNYYSWGVKHRIRLADPDSLDQIRKVCLGDDA
jgi:hypothetical protein